MIYARFSSLIVCVWLCISATAVFADIPIQEWTTAKKIHVIFVPDTSTDLISVNFSFKGAGSKTDPAGKEGLTSLMVNLLFERTVSGSDKFGLQKKLKNLGVLNGLQYGIDPDNIHFSFKCPKEKFKDAFEVVKTILVTPVFDAKELAKAKSSDPSGTRLATSGEQEFASNVLLKKLFSPHPYAIRSTGTMEGRQAITLEDIQNAYKERITRSILVFSVIGNISSQALTTSIENSFGTLPEQAKLPVIPQATVKDNGEIIVIPKETEQGGVVFAQASIPLSSKDYLPLLIVNDIMGGKPFTSRLWQDIRENQGLVYSIHTNLANWDQASLLIGGFESDNKTVKRVISTIREEWKNMQKNGVTEAEFTASKKGLKGGFVLNFATPDGIANYLLRCYLNGLSTHYVNERNKLLEAVSLEEVNRVAQTHLAPEKLTFVVVGNLPE